ncbi:MAG: hypothetical protein PHT48_09680 [Dechloromonas sp.]|nr:hypothetical protein [Dechloromonas sp.]
MSVKTKLFIEIYNPSDDDIFKFACAFTKTVEMPFYLRKGDELVINEDDTDNSWFGDQRFFVEDSHFDILTNTAVVWLEELAYECLESDEDFLDFKDWMDYALGWKVAE